MKIISTESIAEIKIERSIFIGHILPINTVDEGKEYLKTIAKQHHKARHNCWAYVLGEQGETSHSSDDGEPSGSAGKPILGTLQHYELTNTIAVVTRYFGGVKLGVRGLIDAYSQAAKEAIENSDIHEWVRKVYYTIELAYSHHEKIIYELNKIHVNVENTEYTDKVILHISVEEQHQQFLDNFLKEHKQHILVSTT